MQVIDKNQIANIKARLEHSAKSGAAIPLDQAFGMLEQLHKKHPNSDSTTLPKNPSK